MFEVNNKDTRTTPLASGLHDPAQERHGNESLPNFFLRNTCLSIKIMFWQNMHKIWIFYFNILSRLKEKIKKKLMQNFVGSNIENYDKVVVTKLWQNGIRTITPDENCPRLGLVLRLEGNFPRGQLS